jgi:UDP-glucose 4-epimerase
MPDGVLVIGGTGFIGGHLVKGLHEAGYEVWSLGRRALPADLQPFARHVEGNLGNPELINSLLVKCSVVVHAASETVPGDTTLAPQSEAHENLLPTLAFIEELQRHHHKHILFISSGGATYGIPDRCPVAEDFLPRPISYHGACKLALETFFSTLIHHSSHRLTILRPSNIYGPGQQKRQSFGLIQVMLNTLISGEALCIWGDGNIEKDYLYISDMTAACVRAVEPRDQEKIRVFNVGSGQGYSINHIVAAVERVTGRRVRRVHRAARAVDPPRIVLDIRRIQASLQWTPKVSLEEGICRQWRSMWGGREHPTGDA